MLWCCGAEITVSASLLMALPNYHLCREEITLCLAQKETHHQDGVSDTSPVPQIKFGDSIMWSVFPSLLQRLMSLVNGPKSSFKATTSSLPSQIIPWPSTCCQSHTKVDPSLEINPGGTGPSSAPVWSLPALAFTILQNSGSPPGFKMTLQKTS